MDEIYRNLQIALSKLGSTADEVAANLHKDNWVGARKHGVLNPVARYVQCVVPRILLPIISADHLTILTTRNETFEAPLPQPVADFVTVFEAGGYEELAVPGLDPVLGDEAADLNDFNDLGDLDW